MKISGINYESIVDGPGVRLVVYVSGCKHHCEGCHNPSTFDFNSGIDFTPEVQDQLINYLTEHSYISGLTISGGDPMYNGAQVAQFIYFVKKYKPDISVWLYTGFKWEEIINHPEMRHLAIKCDIIVDGPFVLDERDISVAFRGSRNQRIIDVQQSLATGKVIELSY